MPQEIYPSGISVREACREGTYTTVTSGLAPSHIQANLIVLPSRYASDFRRLCLRNPVPCPLLAESSSPGSFSSVKSHIPNVSPESIAQDLDIRRDCPKYIVYQNSQPTSTSPSFDIIPEWSSDHIGFLIGCSFSFETALLASNLPPAHILHNRTVPMYRTNIPLCPAGVFTNSTYVVSMRMYRKSQLEAVREITKPYLATHGEPIAWGWDGAERIGVKDIAEPDWGDPPVTVSGEIAAHQKPNDPNKDSWIPMFWGCGVTPQEAVMRAELKGTIMGHVSFALFFSILRKFPDRLSWGV
ncbi:hypothetical protein UCRPC4_g06351 [Phaeomoniella chlamydospora]|uniref:Duf1445 domain protein n=1 Tax=Phaeomoniella chlamydospora TaxID=158046 RepID=A0A0G2DY19_PHACM|nr:hypothetical protein UCRPC4_g06351 [Phaeomoniella chlamydospora]